MKKHQNDTAVLFIHGLEGNSAQFGGFLSALHGADLFALTLPGHEAELAAFVKSRPSQWLEAVRARIKELTNEYGRVIPVCHSMSGLLALIAMNGLKDQAAGALLIALPLRVRATPAALVLRARSLSPEKPGEDPRVSAARTFCGVRGITVLNSAALLPNTVRFLTLIPRAKKALAQVRCPLTLVFFRRDETVRFSSARLALRLAPHAGIAALDGSSHFYFSPADQATMVSLVQHLIDAPASGA